MADATLTESQRRRIWNGYRGNIDREEPADRSLAVIGRRFLTEIGQPPDWSLEVHAPSDRPRCSAAINSVT
jgi:hypothetical protein